MTSRLLKIFKVSNFAASVSRSYWTASVSNSNNAVVLQQDQSGEQLAFPAVWLRDNCLCPSCFNEAVNVRLNGQFKESQLAMRPESMSCSKNESDELVLEVTWPDNHESKFPLQWLRTHSFDENRQKSWLKNNYFFGRQTWNAETFDKFIRYFRFKEILESDEILLKWLIALNRYGLAIVKDAGTDKSCVEQLANRVGFLKYTTYGKNYIVAAKQDATHIAYTPTSLQLHTDLAYYEYQPSCNFLHFIQQPPEVSGGANQLADGFEVSQQLKQHDPWMYHVLTKTPVEWTRSWKENDKELHHVNRAPVICENVAGEVQRVNFGPTRGSQFCVSIEQANDWYKAMDYFVNLMYHPKNVVQLKMEEGTMLTFVNVRVVHGRSAFAAGARFVVGGYMDWDVVNSKTRGLLRDFKITDVNELD